MYPDRSIKTTRLIPLMFATLLTTQPAFVTANSVDDNDCFELTWGFGEHSHILKPLDSLPSTHALTSNTICGQRFTAGSFCFWLYFLMKKK